MRIAIVSMDTRGGIQPYIALGLGLRDAGHVVRMVAPAEFEPMFARAGLPFAPISGNVEEAVRGSAGANEQGTVASMRYAARKMESLINTWTREALDACDGMDVVTGGVGGMVVALSVAEKLGIPFVETHLQPVGAPTGDYPGVMLGRAPRWIGPLGRRLTHRLSEMAIWMPFKPGMTAARERVLSLSGRPTAADGQPVLYGFSHHVVPVPSSTGRERLVTGYWSLPAPADWAPTPDLEAFLAGDGPVVSIGFGSMSSEDPEAMTALVLGAVRDAGARAVLLSGWGGLGTLPQSADVLLAESVPHDWLFPRVAAVAHHGGAGTTGAALSAGVPAVVVPFAVDQPFWGSRVEALGVGPSPIPRKRLTRGRLADALRQTLTDGPMRTRATALGDLIRAEDGVAVAVERLGRLV